MTNTLDINTDTDIFKEELASLNNESENKNITESDPTFSEIEKSEEPEGDGIPNNNTVSYRTGETINVMLDELSTHPLNNSIYSYSDDKIKNLSQNINEYGLINRIIVNKSLEILSGNLRFKALQKLGVGNIDVYVIDINKDEELEFIISSNQQREKTILDARNEINSLFDKYSPGQGNRESKGENTVKKIKFLTGYSEYKINTIRKIDKCFPEFITEIDKGNISINEASIKCDVIDKIEIINDFVKGNFLDNLKCDNVEKTFDTCVKAYSKDTRPDVYAMLNENNITSEQAYNQMFPNEKPVKERTGEHVHTGHADTSTSCPCCSQRVKKNNKELAWIKQYNQEILEFIVNLKLPANV